MNGLVSSLIFALLLLLPIAFFFSFPFLFVVFPFLLFFDLVAFIDIVSCPFPSSSSSSSLSSSYDDYTHYSSLVTTPTTLDNADESLSPFTTTTSSSSSSSPLFCNNTFTFDQWASAFLFHRAKGCCSSSSSSHGCGYGPQDGKISNSTPPPLPLPFPPLHRCAFTNKNSEPSSHHWCPLAAIQQLEHQLTSSY